MGGENVLVETDYLVVGAGASGLAFVDTLVAETDAEVAVIDRGHAPGGHWLHAYPFVRLHTPSAYYGVNSLTLGEDRIDLAGENAARCSWRASTRTLPVCVSRAAAWVKCAHTSSPVARS
jgi:cation diffusion facilitator CzcD-associated flavoprotein CzcO